MRSNIRLNKIVKIFTSCSRSVTEHDLLNETLRKIKPEIFVRMFRRKTCSFKYY